LSAEGGTGTADDSTAKNATGGTGACAGRVDWLRGEAPRVPPEPPARLCKEPHNYLREHHLRKEAQGELREARVAHWESEQIYRSLEHMGEANRWLEELDLPTRYKPHTDPECGMVVCHIYEDGKLSKEVALDFFERRYRALQSRWQNLAATRTSREQQATARGGREAEGERNASRARQRPSTQLSQEEQADLQRQIRRVTLETLSLADKMRQQLEVLEADAPPRNPFVIH